MISAEAELMMIKLYDDERETTLSAPDGFVLAWEPPFGRPSRLEIQDDRFGVDDDQGNRCWYDLPAAVLLAELRLKSGRSVTVVRH